MTWILPLLATLAILWLGQPSGLQPPSGFRARGITADEVLLWWRDDALGAGRLRLEISTDGEKWCPLADLPPSAVVYSARGLPAATTFQFRLAAVAADGEAAWTEPRPAATFSALGGGRSLYVRPDGDDEADGSAQTPFPTITRAVAAAEPGDTVWIAGGVYKESITLKGGRADAWISYRNLPGEQPVLEGEGRRTNGLAVHGTGFIEIRGLAARNYTHNGISCRETGPVILRRCELYRNGSAGLALNFSAFTAQLLVEDNVTYDNGWGYGWASGIHLNNKLQGENVVHVIRRNLSNNNFDGSDHHTDGNGLMFDLGGTGSFCLIESNICYNNGGRGINVLDGTAYILHNTTFRNAWDDSFEWAAAELEVANRYRNEAGLSLVRNNLLWARPKVRGFGGVIHLVRGAQPAFSGNLVWSDQDEEAMALPAGASAFAAPLPFISAPQDNDFVEIHARRFLRMDSNDYDLRLRSWPAGAPMTRDTGLRIGFGGAPRDPSAPGAGAWPRSAVDTRLLRHPRATPSWTVPARREMGNSRAPFACQGDGALRPPGNTSPRSSRQGFHHHATLVMAADGFLVAERSRFPPRRALAGSSWSRVSRQRTLVREAAGKPGRRCEETSITTIRRKIIVWRIRQLPCCPFCGNGY